MDFTNMNAPNLHLYSYHKTDKLDEKIAGLQLLHGHNSRVKVDEEKGLILIYEKKEAFFNILD